MQFKIGDWVVHPSHGVGHIVRIEEKRSPGKEPRVFYEVTIQKGTVWVPVDNGPILSLRPLTAKGELSRYRSLLKSRPAALNEDHRQRHLEVGDRLRQGSLEVTCEVVRDLTARGWRKPLREADSASLRQARDRLCQEWAAAAGVPVEDAQREIDALLGEARQTYAA